MNGVRRSVAGSRFALFELGAGAVWLAGSMLFALLAAAVTYHFPTQSSAFYEYVGRLITEGKIPYRDVWDNKLPSIYYLNALWQLAFGSNYVLHWIAQLAVLLTTVVAFAAFARAEHLRYWGAATFGLSVLLSLEPLRHYNYTEPYAMLLIMLSLLAAQRGKAVASGILLALGASFWIPASLTIFAIIVYQRQQAERARFLLVFVASVVLFAIVIVAGFGIPTISGLLHDMRSYEALKSDRATIRDATARLWTNLNSTALIVPFVLLAGLIRIPQSRRELFALVWLACALAGAAVNLNFFQHYFIPSVAPLLFAAAVFAESSLFSTTRRVAVAVLLLALIADAARILNGIRSGIQNSNDEARASIVLGRVLDTALPAQSRILVYGYRDAIYLSSKRDASGRFANQFALFATSADLQRERAKQYIRDARQADAVVKEGGMADLPGLAALLRSDFSLICPGLVPGTEIYINHRVSAHRSGKTPDACANAAQAPDRALVLQPSDAALVTRGS